MTDGPSPAELSTYKGRKLSAYRSASWDEMAAFIGPNADRFRSAWETMHARAEAGDGRPSLAVSWPALIFTFAWFFYRRMWLMGVAVLVLPTLIGVIINNSPASVAMQIAIAFFAKGLYLQHAARSIAAVKTQGGGADDIASEGGVSTAGAVVGGVILILTTAAMALATLETLGIVDLVPGQPEAGAEGAFSS